MWSTFYKRFRPRVARTYLRSRHEESEQAESVAQLTVTKGNFAYTALSNYQFTHCNERPGLLNQGVLRLTKLTLLT
jgi:hypothetical protein